MDLISLLHVKLGESRPAISLEIRIWGRFARELAKQVVYLFEYVTSTGH